MPNPEGPNAPPILREPSGGYFAYPTTCCASSRVLTIGTMIPHAPASKAHLYHSTLLPGTRTMGALVPASAMVATISAMSTGLCAVCSISTTSQSKPSRAMILAEGTPGRLNHAPSAGSPRLSFSFTWIVRISHLPFCWQLSTTYTISSLCCSEQGLLARVQGVKLFFALMHLESNAVVQASCLSTTKPLLHCY